LNTYSISESLGLLLRQKEDFHCYYFTFLKWLGQVSSHNVLLWLYGKRGLLVGEWVFRQTE